jgi:hypothetical protein
MFVMTKKPKQEKSMKKETLAEFLARGGKVTIIPPCLPVTKTESIKLATAGGPATILTMGDAELYYGEAKAKKNKKVVAIDLLAHLPEALRKKYVDPIIKANKEDE